MTEHHCGGKNGAQRVGDSLPRNIGSRAVHRLIQSHTAPQARGPKHSNRPYDRACLIGKNVAEHIFCKQHIEAGGMRNQRHCSRIHIQVSELHIWILRRHARHHLPPEPGTIQHVGFVNRSQLTAARAREIKSNMCNTLDFRFAVAHGVDSAAITFRPFSRSGLPEVDPSQKFAHNQDIGTSHDLGTKRRTAFQS